MRILMLISLVILNQSMIHCVIWLQLTPTHVNPNIFLYNILSSNFFFFFFNSRVKLGMFLEIPTLIANPSLTVPLQLKEPACCFKLPSYTSS